MFEKKQSYTPADAKRAYAELDQLVGKKTISPRQAGAYRRHIASRVQVTLKPSYTEQAARRAKAEIVTLTEDGTITTKSAAAYRALVGQISRKVLMLLPELRNRLAREVSRVVA